MQCEICGCSELDACRPSGCSWVMKDPPVCSACLTFMMNVRDPQRLGAILEACGYNLTPGQLRHLRELSEEAV